MSTCSSNKSIVWIDDDDDVDDDDVDDDVDDDDKTNIFWVTFEKQWLFRISRKK